MSTVNDTIIGLVNGNDATSIRNAFRQIADVIDRAPRTMRVTAGVETSNTRTLTFQLVSRRGQVRTDRAMFVFYFASSATGGPIDSQTVGAPTAGTLLASFAPSGLGSCVYLALTDETGKYVVNTTISGAASRFVRSVVVGGVAIDTSDAVAWT